MSFPPLNLWRQRWFYLAGLEGPRRVILGFQDVYCVGSSDLPVADPRRSESYCTTTHGTQRNNGGCVVSVLWRHRKLDVSSDCLILRGPLRTSKGGSVSYSSPTSLLSRGKSVTVGMRSVCGYTKVSPVRWSGGGTSPSTVKRLQEWVTTAGRLVSHLVNRGRTTFIHHWVREYPTPVVPDHPLTRRCGRVLVYSF